MAADTLDAEPVLVLNRYSEEVELACPLFQRRYVWGKDNITQLFADIDTVIDGEYAKRFLGTLVFDLESPAKATSAGKYWVIDGQQRLTTTYLILVAIAELASDLGDSGRELARSTFTDFLVSKKAQTKGNPRLRPTLVDSRQFQTILLHAANACGYSPLAVSPNLAPGEEAGAMSEAYLVIKKAVQARLPQAALGVRSDAASTLDVLDTLRTVVLEQLEFVEITLGSEHDPNEVFDRLNKEGERLGIVDLVRNYVLKHLDGDALAAQAAFTNEWLPFEDGFTSESDKTKYFFPFTLTVDDAVTQATTFRKLSTYLSSDLDGLPADATVAAMVRKLRHHMASYNAIASGRLDHLADPIRTAVRRLVDLGRPASVYPYVMQLLTYASTTPNADAHEVAECLAIIESFLVRRAVCGIEPTGLHAIFKKMWNDAGAEPHKVRKAIVSSTVTFPDDHLFESFIRTGDMYGRKVKVYLLTEYERKFTSGDVLATFPKMTVDHVCPQSRQGEWAEVFSEPSDVALIHTWGNLVPLSDRANSTKGAKNWTEAHNLLSNETVFATTKHVYDDYADWTPRSVRARTNDIVEWAVTRWPNYAELSD